MKKFLLTVFLISNFINSQEIINDTLQATTQNLDEVIVKGIRAKFSTPISYSNIDKDDLESKNLGQDLPVLLNFLPSIVTTSDAGAGIGYTGIRIRGVSPQSTNITINGIPFNDPESMGTFWVNLPDFTSSVESLQVQRGIGTSTNGSGAFGASINILTDLISNKPYAELSSSFGSYNTLKNTIKFSTGKINDHFELSGRLSKIDSDGNGGDISITAKTERAIRQQALNQIFGKIHPLPSAQGRIKSSFLTYQQNRLQGANPDSVKTAAFHVKPFWELLELDLL